MNLKIGEKNSECLHILRAKTSLMHDFLWREINFQKMNASDIFRNEEGRVSCEELQEMSLL